MRTASASGRGPSTALGMTARSVAVLWCDDWPHQLKHSAFGVRRSAFGVRRSAFGVRRSAFGVRRSAFGVRRSAGKVNIACFRATSPSLTVGHIAFFPMLVNVETLSLNLRSDAQSDNRIDQQADNGAGDYRQNDRYANRLKLFQPQRVDG